MGYLGAALLRVSHSSPCCVAGGCDCNVLEPCKIKSRNDQCLAVFKCKDDDKSKRCFKVKACKVEKLEESVSSSPLQSGAVW